VSLMVLPQSLEAQSDGIRFQCRLGDKIIECGIVDVALRDLVSFHRIRKTEHDSLRVVLPELERLVNAKYQAGRLEEDGWVVIRSVDLLRYGFRERVKSAA
jgi:hypothetical protein